MPATASRPAAEYRQAAARHLTAAGLRVLDQGWSRRCDPEAEIDIVAVEHQVLIACRVKVTEPDETFPCGYLTPGQQMRLRRAAIAWTVAHGVLFDELRIDVVTVTPGTDGAPVFAHIRAAA